MAVYSVRKQKLKDTERNPVLLADCTGVSSCPYNHHFLAGFIATWICTSVYSSLI
jgi:hypothetical protein